MNGAFTKVLVIDDDISFRRAVVKALSACGYRVAEESRPLSVIKSIKREEPDLVLLDLAMPQAGGVDIINTMIRMKIEVPVVVISGNLTEHDVRILRERGVKHFLAKPVHLQSLLAKVKEATELEEHPASN